MATNYVHMRTYEGLHLAALTQEHHERTCNYWFTVTTFGATPHTAFRTRAALEQWLEQRGLSLPADADIPDEGTGKHGHWPIIGKYRDAMHVSPETFYAEKGATTRVLSNGDWTLGILTVDEAGEIVTVHYLNPNAPRHKFDWRESQALQDRGEL